MADLNERCDCPPLGMSACPHCGRFYGQAHRDRCHRAAIGDYPSHLWPCGCLKNDAGAHRAGCPDHPEGALG